MRYSWILFLTLISVCLWSPSAGAAEPLPVEQAFQVSVARTGPERATLTWVVAPGHHLYRDQFQVSVQDAGAGSTLAIDLPPGTWRDDPDMGRTQVFSSSGYFEFSLPSSTHTIALRYQGCADAGICYPPQQRMVPLDLAVPAVQPTTPISPATIPPPSGSAAHLSLGILALAFLGGLVLNILPCVLPVLAIKASTFMIPQQSRAARQGLLVYSLGIIVSFMVLGIILAVLRPADAGWGFQLQSPWFVATLAAIFMLMGSALVGWWQLPSVASGRFSSLIARPGLWGDFFAGILAVVVASPCVGPFLGTALAVAFLLPAPQALALFVAMGLGLAFPALLLALVPATRACLPRPGPWMERARVLFGVPLFLASFWLMWVLSRQTSSWISIGLAVSLFLAVGIYRASRPTSLPTGWKQALAPAALALVAILVLRPSSPPSPSLLALSSGDFTPVPDVTVGPYGAQPFSPARLAQLRSEGRVVFVSIGADWCITCKTNEATVLDQPAFTQSLASRNAVWLSGDWTRPNPEIAAFLRSRNAVGVPLYLVFSPSGVRQLPQILTQEEVSKSLL